MKNPILTLALCLSTFFSLIKAENLQIVERNIPVRLIEEIEIKGSSEVVYTQGNETKVVIKGDSNLIDLIVIENKDNTLIISQKDSNIEYSVNSFFEQLKKGLKKENSVYPVIYITSPDLISVALTGSGDFKCTDKLDTDNMEILLKGSGDIEFKDIICDHLHVNLQGSGDIELKKVETLKANYELKGSGDINVKQQHVRQTDINLYGSGDIKVNCNKCHLVNASLTGSGDIDVYGEIEKKTQTVRGSGDIRFH